jgi:ribosomal protein S18 acetylase RimI-like enzyme
MAAVGAAHLRPARQDDLPQLYEICHRTGAAGQDASGLVADRRLLGDLFVAPYVVLEPEHAFVVDDGTGTAQGYVVGARDTLAFEANAEIDWWPEARVRHPDPAGGDRLDALFVDLMSDRPPTPAAVLARYPSHLHIDLLPPYQGGGWGRRLLEALFASLRAAGSRGVHLGVAEENRRAIAFYERVGFVDLGSDGFTRTFGLDL